MQREESAGETAHWPDLDQRIIVSITMVILLVIVLKNAWFADDAMITMRTVVNAAHGYGFTWNIQERVQAYTHPLWMLLLTGAYMVTHELYLTTTVLSLICVSGTLLIIGRGIARQSAAILAASATLMFAKSHIDYSTSGLENPLSHLLLAAFCWYYIRHANTRLWLTILLSSLIALTRMDLFVLIGPALIVATLTTTWPSVATRFSSANGIGEKLQALLGFFNPKTLGAIGIGILPLLAWEIFSLIYYGFLVPNTAYAKLNTGIAQYELYQQGLVYLLSSIRNDPVTLLVISIGSITPLVVRDRRAVALSLGVWLYLFYIVRIGGDFMSGRFLTAPLVVSVALVAATLPTRPAYLLAIVVSALGLMNPRGVLAPDSADYLRNVNDTNPGAHELQGIIDERGFYFSNRSLSALIRNPELINDPFLHVAYQSDIQVVTTSAAIGIYGMTVGPETHVVDIFALTDPLLARLPSMYINQWRIGHFTRMIPNGYIETLERGVNVINDKDLAAYYDKLHLIVSGPLFSPMRWDAIWGMLTGRYDNLIDHDTYRYPGQLEFNDLQGTQWQNLAYPMFLPSNGIRINLPSLQTAQQIELMVNDGLRLRLECLRDGNVVYQTTELAPGNPLTSLDLITIKLPPRTKGYDQIRILPLNVSQFHLGLLRLLQPEDLPTPQFRLGAHWKTPFSEEEMVAVGPASIFVIANETQPYILDLTLSAIYDPAVARDQGQRSTLVITTSAGDTQITDIEIGKPLRVPLILPAGKQRIELRLIPDKDHPEYTSGNSGSYPIFAWSKLRLSSFAMLNDITGITIDGQPQPLQYDQLTALFSGYWYGYEHTPQLRWAAPPASLQIYSPKQQSVRLKLHLRYISNGKEPSDTGILTVVTNGEAAQPTEVWTWQPFVVALNLHPGWNTVELQLNAPPFNATIDGSTEDATRSLSIAVSQIELLTEPFSPIPAP